MACKSLPAPVAVVLELTFLVRFRWAYCQLQELKKLRSTKPKYVKQALDDLPATLDDTYARILLGLEEMYHDEALTLLQWIAYARSPPKLAELVEAAVIDIRAASEESVDVENRGDLGDILRILEGLVMLMKPDNHKLRDATQSQTSTPEPRIADDDIDHRQHLSPDARVRLAHFSVKEYLESKRILRTNAEKFHLESMNGHRFLSQCCLTYLEFYSRSSEKTSTARDLVTFPLLDYAARSWYDHSALQGNHEISREVSLLSSTVQKNDWLLVHDPDVRVCPPFERSELTHQTGCGLYYASELDLQAVALELLHGTCDVNAPGGLYGSALQVASTRGRVESSEIAILLLDHGADVNAQGGLMGNALQAASRSAFLDLVRLLIDKGANVNAEGGHYGHALQAASRGSSLEVVDFLLDKGADINNIGGHYGTALQAASAAGWPDLVQLLLCRGAKTNIHGGWYGSALQAACHYGHVATAQLLANGGADVRAQGGKCGSSVSAAAFNGHVSTLLSLREHGADLREPDHFGRDALACAAMRGYHVVVDKLLKELPETRTPDRTSFEAKDVLGCSLIHHFAVSDSADGISMLLNAGIDPDLADSQGWTALHWSAFRDSQTAALLLRKRGARSDCEDKSGLTAYDIAILAGAGHLTRIMTGQHDNTQVINTASVPLFRNYCDCCMGVSTNPWPLHNALLTD